MKIYNLMGNFSKRIISGIVYVAVFLIAILYSEQSYLGLLTFFAGVCLWEFLRIIKSKSFIGYILLGILSFLLLFNKNILFQKDKILLVCIIYTLVSGVLLIIDLYAKVYKTRNQFAIYFLPIKYIVLPFFFLMLLPFIDGIYKPYIIIYTIIIIWVNDSFAYLVGKNFGENKLFERISPKKTIEGFIGGLVFSVIAGGIIGYYSSDFSITNWVIIAIITSIFGTLGDLIESKFKRQANVKDSGTIMPGHGGLLDRLDSLFFLAPFVYLYIHFFIAK